MKRGKSWLLVRSKPRSEAIAAENIKRRPATVYFPRFLERDKEFPLFPSYLFVQTEELSSLWLDTVIGVARRVRIAGELAYVPDRAIRELRARENKWGLFILSPKEQVLARPSLELGQNIRMISGAFRDFSGIYDGMTVQDRIAVLLSLFGRETRIECDRDAVEAA